MLYIAGCVMEAGYANVRFHDMAGCRDQAEVDAKIAQVPQADVYGISAFCTTHAYTRRLIEAIRRTRDEAYIIVGGPNPTALPEYTLQDCRPDAVIVGEGEDAFLRCLGGFIAGRPPRGVIAGTPRRDIDSYPMPARDLAHPEGYTRQLLGEPTVSLISSRGCPHRCSHCNSVVMGGQSHGIRYRSPESVAAEIRTLRDDYTHFRFNDDNFAGRPDLPDLMERLAELDIAFRIFARMEDLTPEVCKALKDAGCAHVSVGVESVNPDNLRALGRHTQPGHEGNIRLAVDAGLIVRGYFIVGLPHDTEAGIARDLEASANLGLSEFCVYPLIPYPGTDIAKHPERFGYTITDTDFTGYVQVGRGHSAAFVLRHRNFGPEDVQRWRCLAEETLRGGNSVDSRHSRIAR